MQELTALHMVARIRRRFKDMADGAGLPDSHPYLSIIETQEWVAIETINVAAQIGPMVAANMERALADVRAALHETRVAVDQDRERRDELMKRYMRRSMAALGVCAAVSLLTTASTTSRTAVSACGPVPAAPSMETTP